jgi:hypothetical protein
MFPEVSRAPYYLFSLALYHALMYRVYLLQVLTPELEFVRHIENEGLAGRSCTGIAVSNSGLVVVNWRTKSVTELSPLHGDTLSKFSHNAFQVTTFCSNILFLMCSGLLNYSLET